MKFRFSIELSIIKSSILVIVLGLLLFGCGTNTSRDPLVDDSKTGIKEIAISPETFSEVVFQNNRLSGSFLVKNNAGYDAQNIVVSLLGLDRSLIELNSELQTLSDLPGRSLFLREGGEERITFDGRVKPLSEKVNEKNQRYLVSVSYSSKVEFSPTVCIDSGLYSVGSGCDFTKLEAGERTRPRAETFNGQGAPVTFNHLEVVPYTGTESEVELRMKVSNSGRGQLKSLKLGRMVLGNLPLDCEFKGREVKRSDLVEFTEKQSSSPELDLVCTGRLEATVAYKTALFIELFYDYELTVSKNLLIRR